MPEVRTARVTVIPAKKDRLPIAALGVEEKKRLRVAAYARVSTNNEEQLTSYEAQVDYYTRYIQSKEEWEFVEVYTDEGISATNTKKRGGFNRMVEDALAGKIDFIITKSISRFARNTVDTLTTVRKLKEKGIEVFFEKENIRTLDGKGELLITIMSSLAQEESRSISENVTWGQRKRFADGKVSLPYGRFLGYQKGPNGLPEINEQEAQTVKLIFRLFLYGKSPSAIATYLTGEGIPTPGGKTKWRAKATPACKRSLLWISSRRSKRSMRARCRSIMWKTAIPPLSLQRCLTSYNTNTNAARRTVTGQAAYIHLAEKFSAGIAAASMAVRYGIPTQSIVALYGNAMISTKGTAAIRHT